MNQIIEFAPGIERSFPGTSSRGSIPGIVLCRRGRSDLEPRSELRRRHVRRRHELERVPRPNIVIFIPDQLRCNS